MVCSVVVDGVVTFGQPKFLHADETELYKSMDILRVVHAADVVPVLWLGYYHVGDELLLLEENHYATARFAPMQREKPLDEKERAAAIQRLDCERRYPHNHVDQYCDRVAALLQSAQPVEYKDRENFTPKLQQQQ
jgi:hypothetical protein